jgi:hypothetical protein
MSDNNDLLTLQDFLHLSPIVTQTKKHSSVSIHQKEKEMINHAKKPLHTNITIANNRKETGSNNTKIFTDKKL